MPAPLGAGTAVLLGVHVITESQRRVFVGQPFIVVWWGFMMVGAGAMGASAAAPKGRRPMSTGRLRMKMTISATAAA